MDLRTEMELVEHAAGAAHAAADARAARPPTVEDPVLGTGRLNEGDHGASYHFEHVTQTHAEAVATVARWSAHTADHYHDTGHLSIVALMPWLDGWRVTTCIDASQARRLA